MRCNMKKAGIIIILILLFFLLYFLQANFFTWFTIAGVKPNLFVIYILFIGLFTGKKIGATLGFFLGIYMDFLIGKSIGISGIMLCIIGLLAEYFDKNFSKESKVTIILMVMGSTILYEIGNYIYAIIKYGITPEILSFSKILLIEIIFNMFITIIIYPIMQKRGYEIEDVFKKKNILTRYF